MAGCSLTDYNSARQRSGFIFAFARQEQSTKETREKEGVSRCLEVSFGRLCVYGMKYLIIFDVSLPINTPLERRKARGWFCFCSPGTIFGLC